MHIAGVFLDKPHCVLLCQTCKIITAVALLITGHSINLTPSKEDITRALERSMLEYYIGIITRAYVKSVENNDNLDIHKKNMLVKLYSGDLLSFMIVYEVACEYIDRASLSEVSDATIKIMDVYKTELNGRRSSYTAICDCDCDCDFC